MSYHIAQRHVVHKHKLDLHSPDGSISAHVKVNMPADAKVVLFEAQSADFFVWEYHNIDFPTPPWEKEFYIAGTGSVIPGNLLIIGHAGSFQRDGYVWHLFEVSDQTGNMEEG